MYGALPPGAWWEVANGAEPVFELYADKAGDAAVVAARTGDLELASVSFAYPVRKEMAGEGAGHSGRALPTERQHQQFILMLPDGFCFQQHMQHVFLTKSGHGCRLHI